MEAKRQRGRPAAYAAIRNSAEIEAARQSDYDEALASDNRDDIVTTATPDLIQIVTL
ncbi:hypothetical protein [Neorhizobium galegae]|uniref:hypothetical protein n=1 Tax=Neorhizobium galegae TaxID=399 RepID=UPI001F35B14E|nr:hypothetical protein [Neorhizobium galegae]UIK08713.1 hypothetical protein LZK81_24815 [Neorhizobium galegae]